MAARAVADALGSGRIAATLWFDPQPSADELVALTAGHSSADGDAQAIVLSLAPTPRRAASDPRCIPTASDPAAPHPASANRGFGHRRNRVMLAALALTLLAVLIAAAALLPHGVRQSAPPLPDPAIGADNGLAAHPGIRPDAAAGTRTAEPAAGEVAPPAEPPAPRPETPVLSPAAAPDASAPTPALSLPRPLQYRDLPAVGR